MSTIAFPKSFKPISSQDTPKETKFPKSFKPVSERKKQEEPEESFGKSALRTALQPVQGFLEATVPGIAAGFWQLLGSGEAFDPEAIEHLRMISEREGVPFDEEKYLKAAETALKYVPTVSNIGNEIEERTGIPLEAKTKLQKGLRLASTAGKIVPGNSLQKAGAAAVAPTTSYGLQEAGVPEQFAELGGLAAAGAVKIPKQLSIEKATKPSGLPTRKFERLKDERTISASRKEKIDKNLESDFKKISDNLLKESPIEKTRKSMKENSSFKEEVRSEFKDVEELANKIPEEIPSKKIKKILADNSKKQKKGYADNEYEKDYAKFIKEEIKRLPKEDISVGDAVAQYRKNNKALSEAYDPAKPYSYNRAKKDALLEHNRALAEIFENEFPDSQFSKLFKEKNKQWQDISDIEAMDKFHQSIFDKKINFKKAAKLFENENIARPFKRSMGEENFTRYKGLMKDLLSTEAPYNMLKVAKSKGWFKDFGSTVGAYILHPGLAKVKLGISTAKGSYKAVMDAMLDKPELTIKWKKAVDNLKKGNFKEAEQEFKSLDKEVKNQ